MNQQIERRKEKKENIKEDDLKMRREGSEDRVSSTIGGKEKWREQQRFYTKSESNMRHARTIRKGEPPWAAMYRINGE